MIIKNIIDFAYNFIKDIEEVLSADSVVLKLRRSIQLDSYSCGAQCTYMILDYYGIDVSFNTLVAELKTNSKDGTDTKPILKYLKKNDLEVVINRKTSLSDIKTAIDNGNPLLVSIDKGDHWIVIYGYSNEGIFVLDPSKKRLLNHWGIAEFMKRWDENWAAVVKEK
jgi:ABC-type bacteriocin/lantibiotic exporter with double-glycine peptidase domain